MRLPPRAANPSASEAHPLAQGPPLRPRGDPASRQHQCEAAAAPWCGPAVAESTTAVGAPPSVHRPPRRKVVVRVRARARARVRVPKIAGNYYLLWLHLLWLHLLWLHLLWLHLLWLHLLWLHLLWLHLLWLHLPARRKDVVPKTAENFRQLCAQQRRTSELALAPGTWHLAPALAPAPWHRRLHRSWQRAAYLFIFMADPPEILALYTYIYAEPPRHHGTGLRVQGLDVPPHHPAG